MGQVSVLIDLSVRLLVSPVWSVNSYYTHYYTVTSILLKVLLVGAIGLLGMADTIKSFFQLSIYP